MLSRHHLVPVFHPQIENAIGLQNGPKPTCYIVRIWLWRLCGLLLVLLVFPLHPRCFEEPVDLAETETPLGSLLVTDALILDLVHLGEHLHDLFIRDLVLALTLAVVIL